MPPYNAMSTREALLLEASHNTPHILPTGERGAYTSRQGGSRLSDKYPRCSDSFRVSGDMAYTLEEMRSRVSAREILTKEATDRQEARRTAIIHAVPIEAVQEVQAARHAKHVADGQEISEINAEIDRLMATRGQSGSVTRRPIAFSPAPRASPGGWATETDRGANE